MSLTDQQPPGFPFLALLSGTCLSLFLLLISYQFVYVNIYKSLIALTLGSGVLLLVILLHLRDSRANSSRLLYLAALFMLPFIGLMPGYWLNDETTNYFFREEFGLLLIEIIWAWIFFLTVKSARGLQVFLHCFGFIIVVCCLVAILDFNLAVAPEGADLQFIRSSSSFGNANYFASFLILIIPLYIGATIGILSEKTTSRWPALGHAAFYAVVALFAIWALPYTQSRAAIAISILVLCVFLLALAWRYRDRIKPLSWRSKALLVVLLPGLLWGVVESPILSRFASLGEHLHSRAVPWNAAIDSIAERPVFGFGPGSSYELFFRNVAPDSRAFWFQRSYKHAHNQLLQTLEEGGIFGLLCYLLFWCAVYYLIYKTYHRYRQQPSIACLLMGIGLGFVCLQLHSLVSVAYRMVSVQLPMVVCITLVVVLFFNERIKPGRQYNIPSILMVVALVLGAWVTLFPTFISFQQYARSQSLSGAEKLQFLQTPAKHQPNIYSLFERMALELDARDADQALSTSTAIQQALPYYRTTLYQQAIAYAQQGRLKLATQTALEHQQRDLYYLDNNRLLLTLALRTKNSAFFLKQLNAFYAAVRVKHRARNLRSHTWTLAPNLVPEQAQEPSSINEQALAVTATILSSVNRGQSPKERDKQYNKLASSLGIAAKEARYIIDNFLHNPR